MWIFAERGFLSVVACKDQAEMLLVRARVRGDIQRYFPDAKVIANAGSDYKYRALISRERVAEVMAAQVRAIDYTNFKESIPPDQEHRYHVYSRIWEVARALQLPAMPVEALMGRLMGIKTLHAVK